MFLIRMLAMAGLLALPGAAAAQSLEPTRNSGATPTDVKGFRLTIGNPYSTRMTFVLLPMEPGFAAPAAGAEVNPAELTLAPGAARQAIFAFRIPDGVKERKIGLCVQPKTIKGSILPRVCGTYSGTRLTGTGG